MRPRIGLVAVVLAMVLAATLSPSNGLTARAKLTPGTPTIHAPDATLGEQATIERAVRLFTAHGLHLPDLEIRFFDDTEPCDGHLGLFQRQFAPWRILICATQSFVLPHELAHAWEAATLDDAVRTSYMQERGLSSWNDSDLDWNQRGIEDAAVVIQQNLTANHLPTSSTWLERIAAYALLTGRASPLCSKVDLDHASATLRRACRPRAGPPRRGPAVHTS